MLLQLETSVFASFCGVFWMLFCFWQFFEGMLGEVCFFLNFVTTLLLFKLETSLFRIFNQLHLGSRNRGTAVQNQSKLHTQVQENFTFNGESNEICDFRTIFREALKGLAYLLTPQQSSKLGNTQEPSRVYDSSCES